MISFQHLKNPEVFVEGVQYCALAPTPFLETFGYRLAGVAKINDVGKPTQWHVSLNANEPPFVLTDGDWVVRHSTGHLTAFSPEKLFQNYALAIPPGVPMQ